MSPLARTLIAVPSALLALALYTATTAPDEWLPWETDVMRAEITTDGEGVHEGLVRVVVVGEIREGMEIDVTLRGDDVRRSLDVAPADGSQEPDQVRRGYSIRRGLPNACAELDEPGEPETDDTDSGGVLGACTVDVRVRFEGRDVTTDPVTIEASVGAWSYSGVVPGDRQYTVEVSYDPNPPPAP